MIPRGSEKWWQEHQTWLLAKNYRSEMSEERKFVRCGSFSSFPECSGLFITGSRDSLLLWVLLHNFRMYSLCPLGMCSEGCCPQAEHSSGSPLAPPRSRWSRLTNNSRTPSHYFYPPLPPHPTLPRVRTEFVYSSFLPPCPFTPRFRGWSLLALEYLPPKLSLSHLCRSSLKHWSFATSKKKR